MADLPTLDQARAIVDALPPEHRERALAALVCGWQFDDGFWYVGDDRAWPMYLDGRGSEVQVPDHTVDIGAVFRDLVPAMREMGWSIGISGPAVPTMGEPWLVKWRSFNEHPSAQATDSEAPRAAVLAAIWAVGWHALLEVPRAR